MYILISRMQSELKTIFFYDELSSSSHCTVHLRQQGSSGGESDTRTASEELSSSKPGTSKNANAPLLKKVVLYMWPYLF